MEVKTNKEVRFEKDDFLWKYLDFHKFLSFILNRKLFFNRLDKLEDPLEGLAEETLSYMDLTEQTPDEDLPPTEKRKLAAQNQKKASLAERKTEESQQTQFANCWYIGKKESFAMWNIYSNAESVALCYSPQELLDIVIPSAQNFVNRDFTHFTYGFVEYDELWPFRKRKSREQYVHPAFRKDISYKHEQEFRFVASVDSNKKGKYSYFELLLDHISCSSFKILANPYMEDWKYENIQKFLELFKLEQKLYQSALRVKKPPTTSPTENRLNQKKTKEKDKKMFGIEPE